MAMADAGHPDSGSCGGSSSGGGGGSGSGGGGAGNNPANDGDAHDDPSTVPTSDDFGGDGQGGGGLPDDAGAAGYTPLDDLEVYGGAVHVAGSDGDGAEGGAGSTFVFSYHQSSAAGVCGPEDWSDYSDDQDGDNDNDRNPGADAAVGAFYANTAAFGPVGEDAPSAAQGWARLSPGDGGTTNDASSNDDGGGSDDREIDFRAIADRALQSLDAEYTSTVRMGGEAGDETEESPAPQHGSQDTAVESDGNDEHADDNDAVEDVEEEEEEEQSSPANDDDESSAIAQLPLPPARKEVPPIDADAVRRAVQSIRIKSPDLTSNLDDGADRQFQPKVVAPKNHPIIPSAPLAAFRRASPKAVAATANLSRSATVAEAIVRCLPQLLLPVGDESGGPARNTLTVHVVGADHVECQTDGTVRAAFGPLVRWIGAACPCPPARIEVVLLGPNVPMEAEGRDPVTLLPSDVGSDMIRNATARCVNFLHHDYVRGLEAKALPDMVVAFNAGIWGYDEWRPTLEALCELPTAVPVVITAYTVQEAEDDEEVVAEIVAESKTVSKKDVTIDAEKGTRGKCLWEAETNPFGSRKKRETATAIRGREYHENGAWQAWSLGGFLQ